MADSKHILIIEDDDFLRSLAVTKLQKEGFTISTSADGGDYRDLISKQKPDVLLLDLLLPKISGFDILKDLKEDATTKDIKVVIFSNLGSEEDIERGTQLGADEYLVKASFTLDELVDKIAAITK
ncbi:MAG: response regulator [Candidatus Nomurabacteria bacterium]|nr:response regulator [Candidatus Nomurabacteria bacterium]